MEEPSDQRSNRLAKLGVALILISGLLWAPLPLIPFLSITTTHKAVLAGVLFVGVQIAWWTGAALAGPEVVRKIRNWIRKLLPWK